MPLYLIVTIADSTSGMLLGTVMLILIRPRGHRAGYIHPLFFQTSREHRVLRALKHGPRFVDSIVDSELN